MCLESRIVRQLLLVFFGFATVLTAAQAPAEVSPSESLKERASQYYRLVQSGNKAAGLDLVAPESREAYFHTSYVGLVKVSVVDVELSDPADTAKVRTRRASRFPSFPQVLEYETVDTWKRIDGQWFIQFPSDTEIDTPFGKMKLRQGSGTSEGPGPAGMTQGPPSNFNPQPYLEALRKVMEADSKKAEENKPKETKSEPKKTKDTKPEQKQPENQSAPQQNLQR